MPLQMQGKVNLVTMTGANTEYPFPVPRSVKKITVQARQSRDVRMSFEETGSDVNGPYFTIKSGENYYEDYPLEILATTLYFRDPSNAGTVIEILTWQEVGH